MLKMSNNNSAFDEEEYPIFDLWGPVSDGDTPDDLLARIITEDEDEYEDEFFDPDEFE